MSYSPVIEKPKKKTKIFNIETATDEELENSPNLAVRVELLYRREKRLFDEYQNNKFSKS